MKPIISLNKHLPEREIKEFVEIFLNMQFNLLASTPHFVTHS